MKTIAVVEDNPDNRLLLHAMLNEHFALTEYEDGAAALADFCTHAPDLILLDISLPGLDGTAVLKALREDSRLFHIPVVALTAHAMQGDREKYLEVGFDDYVSKPIVDEKVLIETVKRLLNP